MVDIVSVSGNAGESYDFFKVFLKFFCIILLYWHLFASCLDYPLIKWLLDFGIFNFFSG